MTDNPTSQQINEAWHEVVEGKCIQWQRSSLTGGCVWCKTDKTKHAVPDYINYPAVLWRCVVELVSVSPSWVPSSVVRNNSIRYHRWTADNGMFVEDPNPRRAVVLAYLKKEGWEG